MKAVRKQQHKQAIKATIATGLQVEIDRLNALLKKAEEPAIQLEILQQIVALQQDKSTAMAAQIDSLQQELLYHRRAAFGSSSERFLPENPAQLLLDFAGMGELPEEAEAKKKEELQTITYERKKATEKESKKPVREALPEHLERVEIVVEPSNLEEGSVRIGQETSEQLAYQPGKFYVVRTVRPTYALPEEKGVVTAPMPTQALPKSNAHHSLIAHLLISKYMDHLPFHRQMEIFKRSGVHLAASTVNGWFQAAIDLIGPLYEELRRQVLETDYIQIDETTIPVLDKDKPGGTKKGYHWIVRSPQEKKLFFHYDRGSRAQRVAIDILMNFKGAVQSDGYGAYNIYENKDQVTLLGCWAHARRFADKALGNDPERASHILTEVQKLYHIERHAENENLTAEAIVKLRREEAYPILQELEKWVKANLTKVLPQSSIGRALIYLDNNFRRLGRYVNDGRYRIDNNLAENGVRALAIGRKNYMFCGNHEAANRTAIIYSLLGTCKINNVNPTEWFADVLHRINDTKTSQLKNLLPAEWAAAQTGSI